MAFINRARPLSLAAQLHALQRHFPFGCGRIGPSRNGRRLRWQQVVRPHALGCEYTVELRLSESDYFPEVLVLSPDIEEIAGGRKLPHVYANVDGHVSLCLFWVGDWASTKLAAKTVIPWAADWFWFFEHWLHTGAWLGGGTHSEGQQHAPLVA